MASSKDILQTTSRPMTHRPSLSSHSYTSPTVLRQSHSRTNSHTILSGPLTAGHRVAPRRKSVSNNNANTMAAAAAAAVLISDGNDRVPALPIAIGNRRVSRSGGLRPDLAGLTKNGMPSPPASMPAHQCLDGKQDISDSAVDDQDHMSPEEVESSQANRARRASDGQPIKEGRKFNRPEIHCQHCGKGYKHSSCLTKHLWEHTPEWAYTSKLLISKHQQVQLLEAASVLVAMNTEPTSPPDSARETSPSMSGGFSEYLDGRSSANTTPPPQVDAMQLADEPKYNFSPMLSDDDDDVGSRGGLSRSFYPLPSDSSYSTSFNAYAQEPSPPPGLSSMSGEADYLARAVANLSCSYGSNAGSLASYVPLDIPPVPAVPVQFLSQASLGPTSLGQSPFLNSFPAQAPESFTRGERRRDSDVRMDDGDEEDRRSRARSDEEEYGVFGQMEE